MVHFFVVAHRTITIMKFKKTGFPAGIFAQGFALFLALVFFAASPVHACTIFVLTDTNRALFCNNEDWSDPETRIWFLPGGDRYYGAVYVGFENGWAQGGMNTEGLAYDWVAGYHDKWESDPRLPAVRGNSSQRMLETCKTVDDAIAFYRNHRESEFRRARILVADKTGASVIIGAKDGKLLVENENQCRGFGFGRKTLDAALERHPEPTVTNGFKILRDCRQPGLYATKYSNIYDLKTGDIFLYPFPDRDDEVKFTLAVELKKGGHYYDMPKIHEEQAQAPRPLQLNMKRFPLDEFKPIQDKEPEVTTHLSTMIQDAADGKPHADDYTAEAWKKIAPLQKQVQGELKRLGDFVAMTLVDRSDENGQRSYRYRLEFANATILQHFVLDAQNKFASGGSEAVELKPGAHLGEASDGKLSGIGVVLNAEGQNLVIKELVPDSPAAAHKDIHVGDRIIAVAQEEGSAVPVQLAKLAQTLALIRGPAGSTVRLTIVSSGEDNSHARVVSVVRASFDPSTTTPN
jgi:hypothetical protein